MDALQEQSNQCFIYPQIHVVGVSTLIDLLTTINVKRKDLDFTPFYNVTRCRSPIRKYPFEYARADYTATELGQL